MHFLASPRQSFVGLQEQHQRDLESSRERLSRSASSRERSSLIRREVARQALSAERLEGDDQSEDHAVPVGPTAPRRSVIGDLADFQAVADVLGLGGERRDREEASETRGG
jgi:hypothetical protein